MLKMPPLPQDLPWQTKAYLLLDGVSVPELEKRLHRWENDADCLYLNTRWHELTDISPYLILLKGPHDPLLEYFHEHSALEWGYLLFSDANAQTLCGHFRSLLAVEHPTGGEVMLRVADPAVAHQLLSLAEHAHSARWFGPIKHVCIPDVLHANWLHHSRPGSAVADEQLTYRLTDQELTALGEVEFRGIALDLSDHLKTFFPVFMAPLSTLERQRYALHVAQEAYLSGFASEQEITLYANVLGYLSGQPITDHPDIAQLLTQPSSQTPLKRLELAAVLAENRTGTTQGSLL